MEVPGLKRTFCTYDEVGASSLFAYAEFRSLELVRSHSKRGVVQGTGAGLSLLLTLVTSLTLAWQVSWLLNAEACVDVSLVANSIVQNLPGHREHHLCLCC